MRLPQGWWVTSCSARSHRSEPRGFACRCPLCRRPPAPFLRCLVDFRLTGGTAQYRHPRVANGVVDPPTPLMRHRDSPLAVGWLGNAESLALPTPPDVPRRASDARVPRPGPFCRRSTWIGLPACPALLGSKAVSAVPFSNPHPFSTIGSATVPSWHLLRTNQTVASKSDKSGTVWKICRPVYRTSHRRRVRSQR